MNKITLSSNVGIVIQGPTEWSNEMCQFWNQFDCPIVWATWEDEPAKNILQIQRSGIEIVLVEKPPYHGHGNCNLQFKSSFQGLLRLKELNVQHALKVRHDSLFYGVERIWPIDAEISFMHSYNPISVIEVAYWLPKNLTNPASFGGRYHLGADFPLDHAIFGKIDVLINIFNLYVAANLPIPAESLILKKWLDMKGLDDNFTVDYLKSNGLHYWGPDAIAKCVKLLWLKNNWDMTGILYNEPHNRIC